MRIKALSLKNTLISIFIAAFIIIILVFIFLLNRNYEYISAAKGATAVTADIESARLDIERYFLKDTNKEKTLDESISELKTILEQDKSITKSLIFITNKKGELLLGTNNTKEITYDKALKKVFDSLKNRTSQGLVDNKAAKIKVLNENYYLLKTKLDSLKDKEFYLSAVSPENSFMNSIRVQYNIIVWLAIIVSFISICFGYLILTKIMEPIIRASKAAVSLSNGEPVDEIVIGKWALNETVTLVNAVNKMVVDINEAEKTVKLNEQKDGVLLSDLKNTLEELKVENRIERENLEKLVAERKKEIEKVTKELIDKEKLASLGGLVSGIAHEINTPLGVAVTAASYMHKINNDNIKLVEDGTMTKNDFVKYMEGMGETTAILNTNISRAAELVKSFKLIAINQSLEQKSKFLLKEYIETILISLKHEYKKTDVKINIYCPEELVINSYPGAFSQILTNFIMNSLIHGLKEKTGGIIDIKVKEVEGTLKLIYSDNGKGIPKENLEKIFDPFFTTNRHSGGSGLGLSVVYNIVTGQLNGRIRCDSTVGEGVTFTIEIPLERID